MRGAWGVERDEPGARSFALNAPRSTLYARRSAHDVADARRVGVARSHVDRVASPRARLAGEARTDSVGLCRDCPRASRLRARRDSLPQREGACRGSAASTGAWRRWKLSAAPRA